MLTYQSCENVLIARAKKAAKVAAFIFFLAVCLTAIYHIILPGCRLIAQGAAPAPVPVFTEADRAEHYRLLRKHGLDGDVSVLEIGKNGDLYFYRDGKRCRFI